METKKSNNGFPIPFQALYKIWEFFFGFPYLSQLPSLDDDVDCLTIEFGRYFLSKGLVIPVSRIHICCDHYSLSAK